MPSLDLGCGKGVHKVGNSLVKSALFSQLATAGVVIYRGCREISHTLATVSAKFTHSFSHKTFYTPVAVKLVFYPLTTSPITTNTILK